jgi:hypothetical protein
MRVKYLFKVWCDDGLRETREEEKEVEKEGREEKLERD